MAPRFVQVRLLPSHEETVVESLVESVVESVVGAGMRASLFLMGKLQNQTVVHSTLTRLERFHGWAAAGGGSWWVGGTSDMVEVYRRIPKSSLICFASAIVCLGLHVLVSMIFARVEWRQLRRAYEK